MNKDTLLNGASPMKLNQGYLADKNLTSPLFRKSGKGKRGANLQFFK
jgi:hypothetical protein